MSDDSQPATVELGSKPPVARPPGSRAAPGSRAPKARPDAKLPAGKQIGRYVVLYRAGAGGMGQVYAAYDPKLDRKVALKLLRPRGAGGRRDKAEARMLREAQALAKLSHPNVVAIHDVGTEDGQVFLAMDFVEGETLYQWVKDRSRTWQEIVRVFADAGRGLAGAHAVGLVHRDFKPENVVVGRDGRAQVLDFGLAQAQSSSSSTSGSGADLSPAAASPASGAPDDSDIMGTPAYMAPEQHAGTRTDARSDQFSFCSSLYRALYGKAPFAGQGESLATNVRAGNVTETPKGTRVPTRIRRVLLRGLSVDPAGRYPAMQHLLAELELGPWSRPQVVAVGLVGVAALGAGAYLGAAALFEPPQRCDEDRLAGVWDDARKEEIAAAFAASERPYGERVWQSAAAIIDEHADAWRHAEQAACEATASSRDELAGEDYLRMACLELRREELAALADLLASGDDRVIERAVQAAEALEPVATCNDADAYESRTPTPDDADARVSVAAVRAKLVQAQARADSGQYEDGLAIAESASLEAAALEFRPLHAEATLTVGLLQLDLGRIAQAEDTLRDAVVTATAGGHTEAAARAWIALLDVARLKLDLLPQTAFWERHAAALIERLRPADAIEAELLYTIGNVRDTQGRAEAAIDNHRRALALREALHGSQHVDVGVSLRGFGHALRAAGRYDEALEQLQRSEQVLSSLLGPQHPEIASTVTGLAIVRDELGRGDLARPLYDRATEIFERAYGPEHPKVATALNNVAGALYAEGDYEGAYDKFGRALKIWEAVYGPEHQDVAMTLGNLGLTLDGLGRPEESLQHHRRALKITERVLGADHPEVAVPLGNLGDEYAYLGRTEEALPPHQRALEVLEHSLGKDHPRVAAAVQSLGYDYELGGDWERARPLYERAHRIRRDTFGDEHHAVAESGLRLGLALLNLGEPAEARTLLERTRPAIETQDNAYGLAELDFGLAQAIVTDEPDRARELARAAREIFAEDESMSEELAAVDTWLAEHRE